MKTIAIIFSLLISMSAQADVITCYFERAKPAMKTIYNTDTNVLTYRFKDGGHVSHPNMSLQILGNNEFEIQNRFHEVMMRMKINNNGTDGKSFKTYPYTVIKDDYIDQFGNQYPIRGGCSSLYLLSF